jgi:hypothetical protein
MGEVRVDSEQADHYFLEVAHYFPKPGAKSRRTLLSDSQVSQFLPACKEHLSRQNGGEGMQKPPTLWDAYNAVIDWVDHEARFLQGWERLSELWFSVIKDSALYVALKTMGAGRNSSRGSARGPAPR